MQPISLIEHLADFAAGVTLSTVPPEVVKQAKLCVLDTIGCMLAGAALPDAREFIAAESAMSTASEATVLGSTLRLSAEGAARVNGYHGDILELNDLIGGHASIGNVTAALAIAEAIGLTGAEMLRALIAGIEVTARINLGYRQSHAGTDSKLSSEVGIASPGIPNTFGASTVAALAMGLCRKRVAAALGIAGAMAGWCPIEAMSGRGGAIKPILFGGWPASVGIQAAKYAAHGVTGPRLLLEGPAGFYATVARDYDPDIVRGSLGWQLAAPRRKWHACCGYIHAAVDGVSTLLREHGPQLFENAAVELALIDYAAQRMQTEGMPTSPTGARFHAKYCTALAMLGHDLILPEHCLNYPAFLENPALIQAMSQIHIVLATDIPHYSKCALRVLGPAGERASLRVEACKGYPGNPMTDDEVKLKFRRLAGAAISDASGFIENIMALDTAESTEFIARDLA